jgi:hypothetical protein
VQSKRSIVIGSVVMAGLIFGLWRCHPKEPVSAAAEPTSGAPAASATSLAVAAASLSNQVADPNTEPAARASAAEHHEPPPATSAPGQEPYGSTDNTVNDVARRLAAEDLALYSRIERELARDVPKEVHALVALKKSGATRQQLASEIQRTIPDLQLRTLLVKWLDDSFGSLAGPKPPAPGVAVGSGPAHVKPLKARP